MAGDSESADNGAGVDTQRTESFDIRADTLTPGVLYLASGVDGEGKVSSSFIHVTKKRVDYTNPAFKDRVVVDNDEAYRELCRRTIFWLCSEDLQFDDEAYKDASWAAESNEVAREVKLLCKGINPPSKPFDQGVIEANNRHIPPAPFRVMDLGCGIGGNLVYIGMKSDLVVGVECNPQRVEMSKNNAKVHGLSNTHVFEDDIFRFIEEFAANPKRKVEELGLQEYFADSLEFDCVHVSPPWGGKHYPGAADGRIFNLQPNFDIERAMASLTQISGMVSLYLPRSQSIWELVRLASNYGYPLVTLSTYYFNRKIRCLHAHFLKRVECFKRIKISYPEDDFTRFQIAPHGINALIASLSYQSKKVDFRSSLHMDHVVHCLMKLLEEESFNVALKLRGLMCLYPLVDILGMASKALEIQNSGGMLKTNSEEKRTTGGIFFHILKTQYKELYKMVEKLSP